MYLVLSEAAFLCKHAENDLEIPSQEEQLPCIRCLSLHFAGHHLNGTACLHVSGASQCQPVYVGSWAASRVLMQSGVCAAEAALAAALVPAGSSPGSHKQVMMSSDPDSAVQVRAAAGMQQLLLSNQRTEAVRWASLSSCPTSFFTGWHLYGGRDDWASRSYSQPHC